MIRIKLQLLIVRKSCATEWAGNIWPYVFYCGRPNGESALQVSKISRRLIGCARNIAKPFNTYPASVINTIIAVILDSIRLDYYYSFMARGGFTSRNPMVNKWLSRTGAAQRALTRGKKWPDCNAIDILSDLHSTNGTVCRRRDCLYSLFTSKGKPCMYTCRISVRQSTCFVVVVFWSATRGRVEARGPNMIHLNLLHAQTDFNISQRCNPNDKQKNQSHPCIIK